jgi:ACR3 family arsenite efflux pump ArsB
MLRERFGYGTFLSCRSVVLFNHCQCESLLVEYSSYSGASISARVKMRLVTVLGNLLVFLLVFGMSGTVDFTCFKTQLYNAKAIVPGLLLQFLLIPFLGFLVVMAIDMDHVSGLMILAVTCSPGGSYSNWYVLKSRDRSVWGDDDRTGLAHL